MPKLSFKLKQMFMLSHTVVVSVFQKKDRDNKDNSSFTSWSTRTMIEELSLLSLLSFNKRKQAVLHATKRSVADIF